jgi:hypothetical protein
MFGFALILGALATAFLWMSLVAPALARLFRVPLPFWRIDRRNQHLTRRQLVIWEGAFTWGVGMFLAFSVWDYLEWKLLGDQTSGGRLHLEHVCFNFIFWLLAGVIWGFWVAPDKQAEGSGH